MRQRRQILLPAALTAALLLLHVFTRSPDPVGQASSPGPPGATAAPDGRQLGDDRREPQKDHLAPSVLDVGPGTAGFEFYRRMKTLRSNPAGISEVLRRP